MNIRALLESLRGNPFGVSLIIDGVEILGQKVVGFDGNLVLTVNQAGVARATLITAIDSVNF